MRWDPISRLMLVYPGGDDKQQTTTNVHYSPEEAAIRAYLMGEGGNIYARASGGSVDWERYNQAVREWEARNAETVQTPHGPMPKHAPTPKPSQSSFLVPGKGMPEYPGAKPVAASPETLQAREMMKQYALGPGAGLSSAATEALRFGLGDVLRPGSNPALQETINTATRKVGEAYTDPGGVISNIRGNFINSAPGGGSSREGIAMGIAGRNYLNTIGDVTSKITSDAYGQGLDHVARTMGMAPNLYNLGTQPAATLGAVGADVTADQMAQELYQANQRGYAIDAPWKNLQNYANIVHGMAAPGQTTTGEGPGIQPVQRAGMAMGGATIGYQMGGGYGAAAGAAIGLMMSYM